METKGGQLKWFKVYKKTGKSRNKPIQDRHTALHADGKRTSIQDRQQASPAWCTPLFFRIRHCRHRRRSGLGFHRVPLRSELPIAAPQRRPRAASSRRTPAHLPFARTHPSRILKRLESRDANHRDITIPHGTNSLSALEKIDLCKRCEGTVKHRRGGRGALLRYVRGVSS